MKQKYSVTVPSAGLTFSTGSLAALANGSVTVQIGETIVFVAVTAASKTKEGQTWFPLTVEYREKFSAAGRFPGGYFKREGRPSEKEVLTMRLCDRPCRPLFPKGFLNEVQIIGMLLSTDTTNEPDIAMVNGASAALAMSDIPWNGPIACVRVGEIDGQFVVNPTIEQMYSSGLDLIYVGSETEMLMIEGSGDQVPEDRFVAALEFAHQAIQPIIATIKQLVIDHGKAKQLFSLHVCEPKVFEIIERVARARVTEAVKAKNKQERQVGISAAATEAKAALIAELGEGNFVPYHVDIAFEELQEDAYRGLILKQGYRSGARGTNELRELSSLVGVLPRVHGSAIFQRGETQALVTATLGSTSESQDLDGLTGGPKSKSFVLHYNFPPYSVGETGRFGGTSRREIGHGALAERSLLPVVPTEDVFPYTIRLVSDVMASNGSTSMASICGGCLALMDAGVPIIAPVAGISVGLVTEKDASGAITRSITLTDILGEEDHFGDMDFKIAGTTEGITGFQLDLKINGLPFNIVRQAVAEARTARLQILANMTATIAAPRKELSPHAPRIETVQIDPEKIGALIGPGGKNIRRITEITGVQIDIDEDNSGRVHIYSNNLEALKRAVAEVSAVGAKIEEGKIYRGVVRGIKEFGCFVEILPGQEGLVHISELADFRVRRTEDVCKMGDEMVVKCVGIDEKGRVRLSRKAALAEIEAKEKAAATAAAPAPAEPAPSEPAGTPGV